MDQSCQQVLNAFWQLRRECNADELMRKKDIQDGVESLPLEIDMATAIMQRLDDERMHLRAEKIKQQQKQQQK